MENKKSIFLFLIGLGVGVVFTKVFLTKDKPQENLTTLAETQEKLAECESQKDQVSEKLKILDEGSSGKTADEVHGRTN